jgi:hypothetical protein
MGVNTAKHNDLWEAGRHLANLLECDQEVLALMQRYREEGREDWTEIECLFLAFGSIALRRVVERDPGYGHSDFAHNPTTR